MRPMLRLLAWVSLLAAALYVLLVGGAWDGIYMPVVSTITLAVGAAILLGWGVAWVRRPAIWRPSTVMWPAIVAALASLALSTFASRDQRVSLEYLGYAVVLVALYLLLVRLLANPFFRARLTALFTMLFVVLGALFLGLVVGRWAQWWLLVGRLTIPPLRPDFESLTYGNPSAVLTIVTLLGVPTIASFGRTTRKGAVATVLVLLVIGLVALLSGSRAGWLALALTAGVALVAWLLSPSNRKRVGQAASRVVRTTRSRTGFGAVVVLLGIVAIALAPAVLKRVLAGGEENRVDFYVIALRIFVQAPILGTGPGTWVIQRPAFTQPDQIDEYIPYAHNLEVQTLAELGLLGAIAGLIVLVNLGLLFRDGLRDDRPERVRWAIAGALGLTYFFFHQLLDFYENMPAVLIVAAVPVAYLDATIAHGGRSMSTGWDLRSLRMPAATRRAALPILGIATVIAVLGLSLQELPAIQADQATQAANVGQWEEALTGFRSAVASDPLPVYIFSAGLAEAHVGNDVAAAADFESVARTDDLPLAWLNLAAEDAFLGRDADALNALGQAQRLGSQRVADNAAGGALALRLAEPSMATQMLSRVVLANPTFLSDAWWMSDPAAMDVRAAVVDEAMSTADPDTGWQIELMDGQPEAALALASRSSDPSTAALVVEAWDGNPSATNGLFQRCDAQPLDTTTVNWCALVSGKNGDNAAQNRYRQWAYATYQGVTDGGAFLRVATSQQAGRTLSGNPAILWGTYTYRRFTPWDVLVPGLVHLTLGSGATE